MQALLHTMDSTSLQRFIVIAECGSLSEVLPAATRALATDQARLEISYSIGTHEHLLTSLRRGDLDFLVADMEPEHDSADLVQEVILQDQLGVFVRSMLAQTDAEGFISLDATRPDLKHKRLVALQLAQGEMPPTPVRTIGLV